MRLVNQRLLVRALLQVKNKLIKGLVLMGLPDPDGLDGQITDWLSSDLCFEGGYLKFYGNSNFTVFTYWTDVQAVPH